MDIVAHLSVYRYLRLEINAGAVILILAMVFGVLVLTAFLWIKTQIDMMIIYTVVIGMFAFLLENAFVYPTCGLRNGRKTVS